MIRTNLKVPGLSLLLLSGVQVLTACGSASTNFLQTVDLNVSQGTSASGEVASFVNLSAQVDLGNIIFDNVQVPIYDPRTQAALGKVTLGSAANGKGLITLSMNSTAVLNADPSLGATLPNGRAFPSALGVAAGELLGIPILQGSRVYIGGDFQTHIIAGVALGIKALDAASIGVASNLFFFKQVGQVTGVGGVYASPTAGQNGVAVFAKYAMPAATPAPVLDSGVISIKTQVKSAAISSKVASSSASAKVSSVEQKEAGPGMDSNAETKLYKIFYGKKRTVRPQ